MSSLYVLLLISFSHLSSFLTTFLFSFFLLFTFLLHSLPRLPSKHTMLFLISLFFTSFSVLIRYSFNKSFSSLQVNHLFHFLFILLRPCHPKHLPPLSLHPAPCFLNPSIPSTLSSAIPSSPFLNFHWLHLCSSYLIRLHIFLLHFYPILLLPDLFSSPFLQFSPQSSHLIRFSLSPFLYFFFCYRFHSFSLFLFPFFYCSRFVHSHHALS